MMEAVERVERIETVRRQTVAVLDELFRKADEFELAAPPGALERYRQELRESAYEVLVVGEAKRGKSTFVNALIGQEILPTDVDVATSQVFCIRAAEREAYRLRFEDGSAREISREDLLLYGTRASEEAGEVPPLERLLRWIEVDVPVRFVPEGVSILDTPGLGTLYSGHARVTRRFVPEADAVIFVLESGQPVTEDDLRFIEEILEVTGNIFFVQTKIDLFGREAWQDMLRRNGEILEERFGDRLTDARVWPVSGMNLLRAASARGSAVEAYLKVSRHEELTVALRAFLSRVSGWGRVAEAMLLAAQYHSTGLKMLSGRLAALSAESGQRSAELRIAAVESKRRFEEDWGPQGYRYAGVQEGIRQAIAVGKQSFWAALQPGGAIEQTYEDRIDAIGSLKEANQLAKDMPGEVVTAAVGSWTRVCEEVRARCAELLGPFAGAADGTSAPVDPVLVGLAVPDGGLDEEFKHDYLAMLKNAAGSAGLVTGIGSAASMYAGAVGVALTGLALPALLVATPAYLLLAGIGAIGILRGSIKNARAELKNHLAEVLQRVRRHFFEADLASGRFGRVDEYFRDLERDMLARVRSIAEQKSREAEAEISRLTEAARLDDGRRQARVEQVRRMLDEWEGIGKAARDVMTKIKALEGIVAAAPEGG